MPRTARRDCYTEFFHVMIQGLNKEYIFNNELEINTYLKYLKENLKDKNLQIIAYCMMNNHAHFLIHSNDILEISKLMSQVNTKYAIFYNKFNHRCGIVFRNRYKSEQIFTYSHLVSCINYIHNNPVKAKICEKKENYKYSSYRDYKKNGKILNTEKIEDILKKYDIAIEAVLREKYESYKFIDDTDEEDKEKLKISIVQEFLKNNNINREELIGNKFYLKKIATLMYMEFNFKQTEIAETLGVKRLKIHRILHEL